MIIDPFRFASGGGGATFSDNFNRGNEFPLVSPWLSGPGGLEDVYLLSNTLLASGANSGANVITPSFANNQKAQLVIGGAIYGGGPAVRVQANGDCYYIYAIAVAADDAIKVWKVTGGGVTSTQVGSDFVIGLIGTLVATDSIGLSASGTSTTTLEVFLNGVSQGTRSDSTSPHNNGQPGVFLDGAAGEDDYQADDL